mmetsp:Transcript_17734/g.32032  ORF Transcript_17734/g.32032 Transcript_17734/m.32032 type:complete len:425 (-) Transcript_17734:685-1959(-)
MARPFYDACDTTLFLDEDSAFFNEPRRRNPREWDFPPHFCNLSSLSTTPECHCKALELCNLRNEVQQLRLMMYEQGEYMYRLERLYRKATASCSNEPTRKLRNSVESRFSDQHFWEVPSQNSTCVFPNQPRNTRSPGDFSFSNRENEETSLYSFGEIDENVEVGDTGRYPQDSFFLGDILEPKPFGDHEILMVPFIYDPNKTGFEKTSNYPILVGETIADRYKIELIIASTRTCTVLECYDLAENRHVCVKVNDNNKAAFDQGLDEIKINKALGKKSEHVAEMLEYFYFKEHLFLVFELLGDNLYVLSTQPSFQPLVISSAKTIAIQVLKGLQDVHSAGIIHADIKPENIVSARRMRMSGEGRLDVKIVDFGSSCFRGEEPNYYLQSLSYRAPEVIVGGNYDYKIDIWGSGCFWRGSVRRVVPF